MDDFIISANNSSKYMHGIEMLYGTYGTYRPVYECTHILSVMGKAYHMVKMGWICLDVDIHIFFSAMIHVHYTVRCSIDTPG